MEEVKRQISYKNIIDRLVTSRSVWESRARECEDFYYSNVEGTNTQFTKEQIDIIKNDYDIQLTIDIIFAVIQQMLALTIGNKPSSRVTPVENGDKNIAYMLQELWGGLWYKCNGNTELKLAILDTLITGSGYTFTEPESFYQRNTFGVVINHLPWRYVYWDPNSHKADLSDCEYILISKEMSASKAAEVYNINEENMVKQGIASSFTSSRTDETFTEITTKPVTINDLYTKKRVSQGGWLTRGGKINSTQLNSTDMKITPGVYVYRICLLFDKNVLWEGYLPVMDYPISHFSVVYQPSGKEGARTYGMVHFIIDGQKSINKTIAHLILNAQTHGHAKMLIPDGSVDPDIVYKSASDPRMPIVYKTDPNEPTIKPERLMPVPLSNAHYTLFQEIIKMIEYITGIYAVTQGSSAGAPDTFGGIQSLQIYGTQRIKMIAGDINNILVKTCTTALSYLIFYADENKIYRYIAPDGGGTTQDNTGQMSNQQTSTTDKWRTLKFNRKPELTEFDVIGVPYSSTPTTRMLAASLLGTISGQTRDPQVANLLTTEALKLMDIPEADDIVNKIDVIQQLQSQLQQLQQQMKSMGQQNQQQQQEIQSLVEELEKQKVKAEMEQRIIEAKGIINTHVEVSKEKINNMVDSVESTLPKEQLSTIT